MTSSTHRDSSSLNVQLMAGNYSPKESTYGKIKDYFSEFYRPGSHEVGFFSFVIATIGFDMLFLPNAAINSGLIWTIIQLVVSALVSCYSNITLVTCAKKLKVCSFQEISEKTFGKYFRWFTNITVFIGVGGVLTLHLAMIPTYLELFITSTSTNLNVIIWAIEGSGNLILSIISASIIVIPLCLTRYLRQWRHLWIINMTFILVIVGVVINQGLKYQDLSGEYVVKTNFTGFTKTFPSLIFAITNYNVLDVFGELNDSSQIIMKKVIRQSTCFAFFIYLLIIVLGYITFSNPHLPQDPNQLIFLFYSINPDTGASQKYPLIVTVCFLLLSLILAFKSPVYVIPAKNAIRDFFYPRESDRNGQPLDDNEIPIFYHVLFLAGTVYSCLAISILFPNTITIFNGVSSCFWTLNILIFPSLFYLKLPKEMQERKHKIISQVLFCTMGAFMGWIVYSKFFE